MLILPCCSVLSDGVCLLELKGLLTYLLTYLLSYIHDALLKPSECRGDVFTAAMQVQLRVIGERGKSDSVSVDNVRKDSHIPTRTVLDPGLSLMAPYKLDCYLRQGGYVFIGVYSFICLLASKITQKLLRRFSHDSVERRHVYHGRTH